MCGAVEWCGVVKDRWLITRGTRSNRIVSAKGLVSDGEFDELSHLNLLKLKLNSNDKPMIDLILLKLRPKLKPKLRPKPKSKPKPKPKPVTKPKPKLKPKPKYSHLGQGRSCGCGRCRGRCVKGCAGATRRGAAWVLPHCNLGHASERPRRRRRRRPPRRRTTTRCVRDGEIPGVTGTHHDPHRSARTARPLGVCVWVCGGVVCGRARECIRMRVCVRPTLNATDVPIQGVWVGG